MRLSDFMAGLRILLKYYTTEHGYHLGAEHDQIYLYTTDLPLTEPDVEEIRRLGWFQPDEEDNPIYDPDDCWSCYV